MVGSVLGGFIPFPGGALIGQGLGTIIAKHFGVAPTPEAVSNALATTDKDVAIAKLKAAADEARATIDGWARVEEAWAKLAGTQVEQVNETMRAELKAPPERFFQWGWRPATGWVLCYLIAVLGTFTMLGVARAGFSRDPELLNALVSAWPLILSVLGLPAAVVGVTVWSRGQEKIAGVAVAPAKVPPQPVPIKKK
jgi:hypothetical protein